jgi:GH35 family endo-1,4-beta-xylanase
MGVMRFAIHSPAKNEDNGSFHRAYISGLDGRVFPMRIEIAEGLMICRRQIQESGNLNVSWPVEGFGHPVLRTSTLMERDEPYLLPLELARGKISQVRNQLASWDQQGMRIPSKFTDANNNAHHLFAQAISAQHTDVTNCCEFSQQALTQACTAADLLSRAYTQQRLQFRRKRSAQLPALLGCNLGWEPPDDSWSKPFQNAFTAALVPIEWKTVEPTEGQQDWDAVDAQIQWCRDNHLMMYGGPLIDLSPEGLPEWLWQWERDFQNLQSIICNYVETAITRFYGTIRQWEISARVNTGGALALNEEKRLSLAAKSLEVARHVDEEIQLMIGIDQPWGDYQARGHHRLSPFQFVDALVRSGVGLSGVNLEFGIGYRPSGTAPRDLLDFSKLIDQWSQLGIPLYVTIAFPSSTETDPLAQPDFETSDDALFNEATQAAWVERYLPMLMAKQSIVGIFWSHFTDAESHRFPNAGLLRPNNTEKPVLKRITQYRQTYWAETGNG